MKLIYDFKYSEEYVEIALKEGRKGCQKKIKGIVKNCYVCNSYKNCHFCYISESGKAMNKNQARGRARFLQKIYYGLKAEYTENYVVLYR